MNNFINSDATAMLKSMLSIGQPEPRSVSRSSDSSTVSLPGSLQRAIDGISYTAQSRGRASSETPSGSSVFTDNSSVFSLQAEKQTIALDGVEQNSSHAIHSSNVEVLSSRVSGSPNSGTPTSSKVESKRMVRQSWTNKQQYAGNLVAVHYLSSYIAYTMKDKKSRSMSGGVGSLSVSSGALSGGKEDDSSEEMVCVVNQRTVQRVKLSGFTGDVSDMEFARSIRTQLAVLDDLCALFVYSLNPGLTDRLNSCLIVKIPSPYSSPTGPGSISLTCPPPPPLVTEHKRLRWCPYVPATPPKQATGSSDPRTLEEEDDEEEEEDMSVLLAVALHNVIDVWNVEILRKRYSSSEIPSDIQYGRISITNQHPAPIRELVFSPDGSPLASACADGYVRFFSIDTNIATPPKCLQKWKPHNGASVSALIFLDDLKNVTSESQFWKYALTGAVGNSEIKLWSCETWTCLQTLSMLPAPNVPSQFRLEPSLRLSLDPSSQYLALSDVRRKVLYVCKLSVTVDSARISSISEYLVNQSCLSFLVIDAVLPGQDAASKGLPLTVSTKPSAATIERSDSADVSVTALLRLYSISSSGLYLTRVEVPADKQTLTLLSQPTYSFSLRLFRSRSLESSLTSSDVESSLDVTSPTLRHSYRSVDDNSKSDPHPLTSTPTFSVEQQQHDEQEKREGEGSSLPTTDTPHQLRASRDRASVTEQLSRGEKRDVEDKEREPKVTSEMSHATSNRGDSNRGDSKEVDSSKQPIVESADKLISHSTQQSDQQTIKRTSEQRDIQTASSLQAIEKADVEPTQQTNLQANKKDGAVQSDVQVNVQSSVRADTSDRTNEQLSEQSSERTNEQTSALVDEIFNQSRAEAERGVQPVANDFKSSESTSNASHQNGLSGAGAVSMEDLKNILELVTTQKEAINSLRQELSNQSQSCMHTASSAPDDLEEQLNAVVSTAVSRHLQNSNEELQRLAESIEKEDKKSVEMLTTSLTRMLQSYVTNVLKSVVQDEMRKTVLPVVTRSLEPVIRRLLNDFTQKIGATDSALRENLYRMIRAKKTTDAIGQAVARAVETTLTGTCTEVFSASFSKGCREIGRQLDCSLRTGLRQHIQSQGETVSRQLERGDEMLGRVEGMSQQMLVGGGVEQQQEEEEEEGPPTGSLYTELISLSQALQPSTSAAAGEQQQAQASTMSHELNKSLQAATDRLADTLRDSLRVVIREEIDSALRDHQSIISERIITTFNSRAATPAPFHGLAYMGGGAGAGPMSILQIKAQIEVLLQQNEYNAAFSQALVAADLGLLMYVCETVDSSQLFADSASCPLQQTTLLSLIQQLSVDLRDNTLLKHQYLEEAVMKLDMQNVATREHAPSVLRCLRRAIEAFFSSKPEVEHNMRRQFRMLNIAVEALLSGAAR